MNNEVAKKMQLNDNDLMAINGGAIKWGVIGLIVGASAFIAGIIDGYLRPFKCR